MRWPQVVVIVMLTAAMVVALVEHGKPKTGDNNFWVTCISVAVWVLVLRFGGFWK